MLHLIVLPSSNGRYCLQCINIKIHRGKRFAFTWLKGIKICSDSRRKKKWKLKTENSPSPTRLRENEQIPIHDIKLLTSKSFQVWSQFLPWHITGLSLQNVNLFLFIFSKIGRNWLFFYCRNSFLNNVILLSE